MTNITNQQILDEGYLRLRRIAVSDIVGKYKEIYSLEGSENPLHASISEIESFVGRVRPFLLQQEKIKFKTLLEIIEKNIPQNNKELVSGFKKCHNNIKSFLKEYNKSKNNINNPNNNQPGYNDYDLIHILIYEDFIHMSPTKNKSRNFDADMIYPMALFRLLDLVDDLMFLLLILEELRVTGVINISNYVFESRLLLRKMSSKDSGTVLLKKFNPMIKAYWGDAKDRNIEFSYNISDFSELIAK